MATANYVLLEKITVGAAGASSVTFSGIPQTGYTDLKVVASVRSSSSYGGADSMVDDLKLIFNGSTASNYSSRRLAGDGSGLTSTTFTSRPAMEFFYIDGSGATASTFGNTEIYIPNYTSSASKSLSAETVGENNATKAYMNILAGLWNDTSAITSITFSLVNGSFVQFTTFYLYGVAKLGTTPAIVPYATGGDTIMTDGTYWYHTFLSSGTFTPTKAISCDYLVVAGGAGGGSRHGGGGGAGGFRTSIGGSALSLSSGTNYTVTVGAGGTGGTNPSAGASGTAGSNSVFSTITSNGGGAGAASGDGASGGSGGGGGTAGNLSGGAGGAGNTPSTTPSQGNNGGSGLRNDSFGDYCGGGGGGAGGTGGNASVNPATGGSAGSGSSSSISGSAVTYAAGGSGGGFDETTGSSTQGATGGANTGNGGGGSAGGTFNGGAGGSGIVVVRYAV